MTVLVTGGAGYIGSHMVLELVDHGEEVVVIDRLSTGFEWAVSPAAELIVGDVGDFALVSDIMRTRKVDGVLHFAGSIVVPESVAKPLEYYENNTARSRTLIAAAVEAGIDRFVFSSTAAVYGTPDTVPVDETAPCRPLSPYGWSKWMTERMLADAALAHDFRYCALRYFNVAGADPKGRSGQSTAGATHLLKVASEVASGKRDSMMIFGTDYPTEDGTCIRDYIHVSDLVAAHRHALEYLQSGGDSAVFNLGYGRGFSVRDVLKAVEAVHGAPIAAVEAPRRPGDATTVVADASAARSVLGWAPAHDDLQTIASHALAWERRLAERNAP